MFRAPALRKSELVLAVALLIKCATLAFLTEEHNFKDYIKTGFRTYICAV